MPAWAYRIALTQVRITTPEQLRWFATHNRTPKGAPLPYQEAVKPHNVLSHAIVKDGTGLPEGADRSHFCLVAPAGERRRFVNRYDPKRALYVDGVDVSPKTYADVIRTYGTHPERKFAEPDGRPCQPGTRGLLRDLPLVATGIKHVGKEGNELDAHKAGLVTEAERQLEYDDSFYDDLARVLRDMPTADVARQTGYDRRTVRRLKRGECRPSRERLPALLERAADHCRENLKDTVGTTLEDDRSVVGIFSGLLSRVCAEQLEGNKRCPLAELSDVGDGTPAVLAPIDDGVNNRPDKCRSLLRRTRQRCDQQHVPSRRVRDKAADNTTQLTEHAGAPA